MLNSIFRLVVYYRRFDFGKIGILALLLLLLQVNSIYCLTLESEIVI